MNNLTSASFCILLSLTSLNVVASQQPKELTSYLNSVKSTSLQYGTLLQNYADHFSKKCRRNITVKELQSPVVNKLITATFSSQRYGHETVTMVNRITTNHFNCMQLDKPFKALQNDQQLRKQSPSYVKLINMMGDVELNGDSEIN
ncbi:hypothetical protein PVK62_07720 [Aliivibrio sp. S3MY1]|uniref:Lipoprotein n=1 Tax=Aliivibrio wodanis TaxID=80852 RepID=A0A5Q4ZYD9_9GAMM|nr:MULTISPECIES: hypothetical protein [Aliivibrio]MDD9195726.1 hypothetical protein [Aliivibrio sp. S3MY1]VVV06887.1 hypothetical protein AW0309160_04381 [Aliivibrio wodanis]